MENKILAIKKRKNIYIVIGFFVILAIIIICYFLFAPKYTKHTLRITPRGAGSGASENMEVAVPQRMDSTTRPNVLINEWEYTDKEIGLHVNVVALPVGIDYAKRAYIGLEFREFNNGELDGWHIVTQDRFDVYVLQKDQKTFIWITAELAEVTDKSKARIIVRDIADSITFKK